MTILTIVLIAFSVAMDAFAIAICKGVALKKYHWKNSIVVGLWFGFFQAMMPLIGYLLGDQFYEKIVIWDHWIAFGLLSIIGLHMIKEAYQQPTAENASLQASTMLVLALATSMDALAIGITLAFLQVHLLFAILCIGLITAILSMLGVYIGCRFGALYQKNAEIFGGCLLILLGLKILFEHIN